MTTSMQAMVLRDEDRMCPELGMERATIGLLTHGAGDPNNRAIWAGAADAAREQGANLICFPGKPLRSALEFEAQSNVIFDLVNAGNVDGLVLWLAGLTLRVDLEEIRRFSERYRPLPIVGVGSLMEDIPCVMVDNYHGMRDVVEHLLSEHGRRRIAFVRGPEQHQEAEQRYQAYLDALAEHDIAFDPTLVVVGNFKESGGGQAVAELLDRRGAHFDALVAASDNMAIGAMKVLQARGVRIPDNVALAGLNDEAQSRVVSPPLTTGPLHFYEQARQATLMVLALIRGEAVPERVTIPTRLLARQSCGCPAPSLVRAGLDVPPSASSMAAEAKASGLLLPAGEGLGEALAAHRLDRVQAAFLAELAGKVPGQFLAAL
jgi:DNA-binding LacI/PurR family transcriptional regulator